MKAIKALLVDDIEFNRLVGYGMLVRAGVDVDVVESGQKAIQAVCDGSYDIVFMDLEMPDIDGYTTCQKIRALGKSYEQLPIVALSAHCTTDDVMNCQLAGMNDHVALPIDSGVLESVIKKYTGINWENEKRQLHMLRQTGVDITSAIERMAFNRDAYFAVLENFCKKYQGVSAQIDVLLANKMYDELAALLHVIKGNSGSLGVIQVYQHSNEAKCCLGRGDIAGMESVLRELQLSMANAITGIKQYFLQNNKSSAKVMADVILPEPEQIKNNLYGLCQTMDQDMAKAEAELQALLPQLKGSGFERETDAIKYALEIFDLDQVKKIIEAIAVKI